MAHFFEAISFFEPLLNRLGSRLTEAVSRSVQHRGGAPRAALSDGHGAGGGVHGDATGAAGGAREGAAPGEETPKFLGGLRRSEEPRKN